ncbi:unnamed protein product [Toxocara canis]|uniref:Uncharacterized protein n=1 Tax=Toxocara canis TaxID=6265 RepID=A0A183UGW0_TOXCA|nr:unnamed protein product [Toxocara canis]
MMAQLEPNFWEAGAGKNAGARFSRTAEIESELESDTKTSSPKTALHLMTPRGPASSSRSWAQHLACFTNHILLERPSELRFDDIVKTLKQLLGRKTSVLTCHYACLGTPAQRRTSQRLYWGCQSAT